MNIVDTLFDDHTFRLCWAVILGVSGLSDILGTILPKAVKLSSSSNDNNNNNNNNTHYYYYCNDETSSCDERFLLFVEWVDRNDLTISFVFSMLLFLDAFLKARRRNRILLIEEEREELFNNNDKNNDSIRKKWWKRLTFMYYATLLLQLLLLPIGFYIMIYYRLCNLYNGNRLLNLNEEEEELVLELINGHGIVQRENFFINSKKSLFEVLFDYFGSLVSTSTKAKFSILKKDFIIAFVRKVFRYGIKNPIKLRRQIKKWLGWVRIVLYSTSILGTLNRVFGLMKLYAERRIKREQRKALENAQKERRRKWLNMTQEEKGYKAATLIQSVCRSRQTRARIRKANEARRIFLADKKEMAVIKVQQVMRKKLQNARIRLQKKKTELEQLYERDREDRIRHYQLEREVLIATQDLINKKLLLRPNATFSVYWKLFFAILLLYELTPKALAPIVRKHGKSMTTKEFIAETFIPVPVSELDECQCLSSEATLKFSFPGIESYEYCTPTTASEADKVIIRQSLSNVIVYGKLAYQEIIYSRTWYCYEPSVLLDGIADFMALALTPAPLSEWPECKMERQMEERKGLLKTLRDKIKKQPNRKPRWYCQEKYFFPHKIYRQSVDFFLDGVMEIVSFFYFADVFVTFFTGEFDPVSGCLVPKQWFQRWVFPGILMQLLLNPKMKEMYDLVSMFVNKTMENGIIRTFRWNLTVIVPLLYHLGTLFVRYPWAKFCELQNAYPSFSRNLWD